MISVIIPTYNRYDNLQNAIKSVLNQTYTDFELIIVDDSSTDKRYNLLNDITNTISCMKYIRLEPGSKEFLGYGCGALTRNKGLEVANGEYIAFLDDDDVWMPNKLELQIKEMKKHNLLLSSTEGYIGYGFYNKMNNYKKYNSEYYWNSLQSIYGLQDKFPEKFTLEFVKQHNPIITSSIMFHKSLVDKYGYMKLIKNGGMIINGKREWQDWEYWKRIMENDDCLYIDTPLFYYDLENY